MANLDDIQNIEVCELEEQVNEIAKLSGISITNVKKVLIAQRRHAQQNLRLGRGYNIKGIVKILPKEKAGEIALSGVVSQAVVRPTIIRTLRLEESPADKVNKNRITDEDLE